MDPQIEPAQISSVRRLNSHRTARLADDIPPAILVAKHVTVMAVDVNTNNRRGHWFWSERKGTRAHDSDGQAMFKWRGLWFNVVRVLLQHRLKARSIRAVNACGLPQCVNPDHWTVAPSFLGLVSAGSSLSTMLVGGTWRLASRGTPVKRDMVLVAKVTPSPHGPRHVVRALYEENETAFLTTCGIVVDPRFVVAGGEASCEACLR